MKKTLAIAFGFMILMFTVIAWAAPVPDTGQTKCYNATVEIPCPSSGQPFYGQDANYTINPPSYTKLDGSGNALPDSATSWTMVKDNVTGLIWEMKTNKDGVKNYTDPHDADNTYTWYDSNPATNGGNVGTPGDGTDTEDFIKALNDANYGGFSDWRMSTIDELSSLINYSIPSYSGSAINTGYFPNTVSGFYCSSTTYASDTNLAWGLYFGYGFDGTCGKGSYGYYVRAVRGGQSGLFGDLVIGSFYSLGNASIDNAGAAGNFTDNYDGTVTDTSTGLMWQQTVSSIYSWEQSLAYCEDLNLGGYTDWRLPTIKELRSIVDYSRYDPSINMNYFPNTVSGFYWSSTASAFNTSYAWSLNFGYGFDNDCTKKDSNYVRAVRGGQSGSLGHLVILSPYQGEKWNIGNEKNITWNPQDIAGNVAISISRDGGKTYLS